MRLFLVSIVVVWIYLLGCADLNAQQTQQMKCVFLSNRIVNDESSLGYTISQVPFDDCWVYVFRLEKNAKNETLASQVAGSPARTDVNGRCSFEFLAGAPYYFYFAGKQLSNKQEERIRLGYQKFLYRAEIGLDQSGQSDFSAELGNEVVLTLNYSLPLWMTVVHKLEERLVKVEAEKITKSIESPTELTLVPKVEKKISDHEFSKRFIGQLRRLYFDSFEWDLLIANDRLYAYSFDPETGRVLDRSGVFDICQELGPKYLTKQVDGRVALVFDNAKKPIVEEVCDLVTVRTTSGPEKEKVQLIRISKVLAALDCKINTRELGVVPNSVAVATYGRSISLAMLSAVSEWDDLPTSGEWNAAVAKYCSDNELESDVIADTLAEGIATISEEESTAIAEYVESNLGQFKPDRSRLESLATDILLWNASPHIWGGRSKPPWPEIHDDIRKELIRKGKTIIDEFLGESRG